MLQHPETEFPKSRPLKRGQNLAAWIWGGAFAIFIIAVFCFAPASLPEYKQRILAFACALLAGFFGYFLTGRLAINAQPTLPWLGKTAIKGGGGAAIFLVVLAWWYSPVAPVQRAQSVTPSQFPATTQVAENGDSKKYDPESFVTGFIYRAGDIRRNEYSAQPNVLPEARQDQLLTLPDVAFDTRQEVVSATLQLQNVTDGPLALALKKEFFTLEDDAGQTADLVYSALPTGIVAANDSRSIRLYFKAPHGWQGKCVSAQTIRFHVDGLLPVIRAIWSWHTLATAD